MDQSPSQSNATQPTYQPGIADILAVKNLFYETSSPLPIELVDVIMDMAEIGHIAPSLFAGATLFRV